LETKESIWEMPDDVADLVGQIMAQGMEMEVEEGDNEVPDEEDLHQDHEAKEGGELGHALSQDADTEGPGSGQGAVAGEKRKLHDDDGGIQESEAKKPKQEPEIPLAEMTAEQKLQKFMVGLTSNALLGWDD
jgi:hypothetical protein